MGIKMNRTLLIVLILTICIIVSVLAACNASNADVIDNTTESETDTGSETVVTDYISTIQEIEAPPAEIINETQIIENHDNNTIYYDNLKWYLNEDIVSLGFAEMYISASAKRTDPKYSQLRDPEIRLIHLIGDDGAKEINTAIDKAVTEPYSEYITQIKSGDYTSENLFVCQSNAAVYKNIALINISYFTYSGTIASGGHLGEPKIFYYDYVEDKALSVSDVLNTVAINDETFLDVFNTYTLQINSKASKYTFENIEWLLPVETGITVCIFFNEYDDYPTEFTIPYNMLT